MEKQQQNTGQTRKNLHKVISSYRPVQDSQCPSVKKSLLKKSVPKQYNDLDNLQTNLKQQERICNQNKQMLIKNIQNYYIRINQELQKQRNQLVDQIRQEYNKVTKLFRQYQLSIRQIKCLFKDERKLRKQAVKIDKISVFNQLRFIQVPTIQYKEADDQQLKISLANFKPTLQFSRVSFSKQQIKQSQQNNHKESKNIGVSFALIHNTKKLNQRNPSREKTMIKAQKTIKKQNHKIQSIEVKKISSFQPYDHLNQYPGCYQQDKTVNYDKKNDFLMCQQQFQWGFEPQASRKGVVVSDVIIQEPESKENSLLSQDIK